MAETEGMGRLGGFCDWLNPWLGWFRVSRAGWCGDDGAEEDDDATDEADGKIWGRGFWKLDAREEEAELAGNEYTSGPEKDLAYFFQHCLHGFWGFPPL
jgi:hypothetical protein